MVRIRAILDLANRGVKTEQVAAALASVVMKDKNVNVHEVASDVLYSMPEQAKAMLPSMVAALRDTTRSTDQRSRAAEVIRDMRGEAAQAVFPLLDIVQRKNAVPLRSSAVRALAAIGTNRISPTVTTLTQILSDAKEDIGLRRDAADALGEGGTDAESAMVALSSVLKNEKKELKNNRQELALRESAATAIGKIGSQTQIRTQIDGLIDTS
jgi:HEAT repeat protein